MIHHSKCELATEVPGILQVCAFSVKHNQLSFLSNIAKSSFLYTLCVATLFVISYYISRSFRTKNL